MQQLVGHPALARPAQQVGHDGRQHLVLFGDEVEIDAERVAEDRPQLGERERVHHQLLQSLRFRTRQRAQRCGPAMRSAELRVLQALHCPLEQRARLARDVDRVLAVDPVLDHLARELTQLVVVLVQRDRVLSLRRADRADERDQLLASDRVERIVAEQVDRRRQPVGVAPAELGRQLAHQRGAARQRVPLDLRHQAIQLLLLRQRGLRAAEAEQHSQATHLHLQRRQQVVRVLGPAIRLVEVQQRIARAAALGRPRHQQVQLDRASGVVRAQACLGAPQHLPRVVDPIELQQRARLEQVDRARRGALGAFAEHLQGVESQARREEAAGRAGRLLLPRRAADQRALVERDRHAQLARQPQPRRGRGRQLLERAAQQRRRLRVPPVLENI